MIVSTNQISTFLKIKNQTSTCIDSTPDGSKRCVEKEHQRIGEILFYIRQRLTESDRRKNTKHSAGSEGIQDSKTRKIRKQCNEHWKEEKQSGKRTSASQLMTDGHCVTQEDSCTEWATVRACLITHVTGEAPRQLTDREGRSPWTHTQPLARKAPTGLWQKVFEATSRNWASSLCLRVPSTLFLHHSLAQLDCSWEWHFLTFVLFSAGCLNIGNTSKQISSTILFSFYIILRNPWEVI